MLLTALMTMLFAHSAAGGGEPPKADQISQKDARVLATTAFVEATKGSIPKYSVRSVDDPQDKSIWRFRFEGSEQYARPGFHAIVKIDKRTKKAEVLLGE
jgi:hypothetical protein